MVDTLIYANKATIHNLIVKNISGLKMHQKWSQCE